MKKQAFTLVELLVVIAIIGLIASFSVIALGTARAKSRDSKRVADIEQIKKSLELFFSDNNRYPTDSEWARGSLYSTTTDGATTTYLSRIPSTPTPADGSCTTEQNTYTYTQVNSGDSYTINFCLGSGTGSLSSGYKLASPGGIEAGAVEVSCLENAVGCSWSSLGSLTPEEPWETAFTFDGSTPYVIAYDSLWRPMVYSYTGSAWSLVGTNPLFVDGGVCNTAITTYNGVIYAAYTDVEVNGDMFVHKYENGAWSQVGGSVGFPDALCSTDISIVDVVVLNGTPYASFTIGNNIYVKKYNGSAWVDAGSSSVVATRSSTYSSMSMVAFAGDIYLAYQNLASSNRLAVKKLTAGTGAWATAGNDLSSSAPLELNLSVAGNNLYLVFRADTSGVLSWSGSSWVSLGDPGVTSLSSVFVYNDVVYLASRWGSTVRRYDGSSWSTITNFGETQSGAKIYTSLVGDILYVGYENVSGNPVVEKFSK